MERGHQVMADEGSQQRKPNLRSAVEDVKALVTVLVMELQSVLGRRLKLRSPAVLAAIGVVATLVLAVGVVMALLRTGDANAVSDNAALIGALVALGGVFTAQMVSIALDDRRTQEARDLEAQRAGEAALQNYFEEVGELLIEKSLREASPGDTLSTVVRAQTLSVLAGLDPGRKRILLLFLYESGLIFERKPVVSLAAANLGEADLVGANLREAILSGADLRGANLSEADLSSANLRGAILSRADLGKANLKDADLKDANLSGAILKDATNLGDATNLKDANLGEADLFGAYLFGADLFGTDLRGANLKDATLNHANLGGAILSRANLGGANLTGANLGGADLKDADLVRAKLSGANLSEAELRGANLTGANLTGADLFGTDVSDTNLKDADLTGAADITTEDLERLTNALEGTIMPDGSKHP